MTIICGLIAQGSERVGEYVGSSSAKKIGDVIVQKILPKLPASNHKKTLTQKEYVVPKKICTNINSMEFHYKVSGQYVYFCVAKAGYPKRVCWAFVDDMETEFLKLKTPSASKVKTLIQDKMTFYNDPNNDKISRLKNKVEDVKDVMIDNIGTFCNKLIFRKNFGPW